MSASVRVLLVLPMYGGSLPVGRYCASALRQNGQVVEVFEAPEFYGAFSALKGLRVGTERLEYLENGFLQLVSQAVLAKVESFAPDLVLAMAQAPLSRQVLQRLRKDGVATAMWFVEDFQVFGYWRAFAPFYDVFAVIQKEPFLSELAGIGQDNALYLPMAADPAFHRPVELSAMERRTFGSDVSFLGAGYPNRRLAFRQLMQHDFKIWGNDWDGEHLLERLMPRPGERISSEECVKIFNASKINLNLHSSVKAETLVGQGDFVNPRTFELAACGAFQLVDRRGLLPELFGPDELATFETMQELEQAIDHYLSQPEARQSMAARARQRVLAEHTYAHRMQRLLEFTAERLPGWPPARNPAPEPAGEALPQEFRSELQELLERLQLPANAAFEDLVWAVRQQEGELSEMETAVLFLDEWRKEYLRK